ncbi:MAG: dihydrofolate reductase [Pannonibacter phragmitetus]
MISAGGKMLETVIVSAVAENGVIGADNAMPWRLPSDLKHFKALTLGKPVVMGRKTFESLGKPLPGRPHVVISRQPIELPEGVHLVQSLESALELAAKLAAESGAEEVMIIGGGQIYAQAMAHADRLELTRVHATPEGDTVFPAFSTGQWELVAERAAERSDKDSANVTFQTYRRRTAA